MNESALPPGSLKRYPLSDQIVEWLSSRIVSGELPPGAPLSELELAETLGCSRSPLREAFRILAYEGLVELNPGRMATVASLHPRTASDFFDTRVLIESEATRLATMNMTEPELRQLQDLWTSVQAAVVRGDRDAYQELNREFHSRLYALCKNEALVELIGVMWRRTRRYSELLNYDADRLAVSMEKKKALLAKVAVRNGDGAAQCMADLILARKSEVVRALTEGAEDPFGFWGRDSASGTDSAEGDAVDRREGEPTRPRTGAQG